MALLNRRFTPNTEFVGAGGELTAAEEAAVQNLTALAASGATQAVRKVTATTFANVNLDTSGLLAAPFVVTALTGELSSERVLTGTGNQVTVTDGGAGGTITLSLPQSIAVSSSPIFASLTLTSPLTVANGGTGAATLTGLLVGNGASAFTAITTSADLAGQISDETGTGVLVFGTAPTFTTSITDPLVIGGTGTTSTLTLRSTSGVGAAGADIIFQTGNNGATEAMRILNSGNVGIGTGAPGFPLEVVVPTASGVQIRSTVNTTGTTSELGFRTSASEGISWSGVRANRTDTPNVGDTDLRFFTTSIGATSEKVIISTTGNVGIGTVSPSSNLDIVGTATVANVIRYSANAFGPQFGLRKSRGTEAAPTTVSSGDTAGNVFFWGHDGTAFIATALVSAAIDGTPGTNDMPGRLVFSTTADGASGVTERMRITSSGNVGIGDATPTAVLDIAPGTARSGSSGVTNGWFSIQAGTYTDSATAGSGTAASYAFNAFATPTLAATNTLVTTTDAANVYIANPVAAGTNMTLTRAYALWVDNGVSRFDSPVYLGDPETGSVTPSGGGLMFKNSGDTTLLGERRATSNVAGRNLNIQPGGASSGATDKAGGVLGLRSGIGTGTGGSAIAFSTYASITTGAIGTVALRSGGTGYAADEVLTLTQTGSGGDATITVNTVDGSGVILTATLTTGGTSYKVSNGNATTITGGPGPGTGTGATFDVSTITGTEDNSLTEIMRINSTGNSKGFLGLGIASPLANFHLAPANRDWTVGTTAGVFRISAATFTDALTLTGGTAASAAFITLGATAPTFAALNTGVTITDAATVYINNAPAAGTNVTITNPWALWVDVGDVRLDGNLQFNTNASSIIALGTGSNGLVLKNLKNSANTTVSGTVKTVEIDIGGTPYYFLVSPTSSA